jgi:tRNA C32,U32 (ribose-2'-O)-methylase TrmJ
MMVALKQLLGRKELHVDDVKILEDVLVDIVRDVKNLRFHNDDHHHKE